MLSAGSTQEGAFDGAFLRFQAYFLRSRDDLNVARDLAQARPGARDLLIGEGRLEVGDERPPASLEPREQFGDFRRRRVGLELQPRQLGLGCREPGGERRRNGEGTGGDRVDQTLHFALQLGDAATIDSRRRVSLQRALHPAAGFGNHVGGEQLILDAGEDPGLDNRPRDPRIVFARTAVDPARAGVVPTIRNYEAGAAIAALEQPGQ
ncbi:MAG TPA: hypothetical protein VMM36_16430 [Opitutaceae bacterium]|nr:hypothetical protein [Opitutaceae bacterium]